MNEFFRFPMVVLITTVVWLSVTFLTSPESKECLINFYLKIKPGGPGWNKIVGADKIDTKQWNVPNGIIAMLYSLIMIYCILFSTGYFIYGNNYTAICLTFIAIFCSYRVIKMWKKLTIH